MAAASSAPKARGLVQDQFAASPSASPSSSGSSFEDSNEVPQEYLMASWPFPEQPGFPFPPQQQQQQVPVPGPSAGVAYPLSAFTRPGEHYTWPQQPQYGVQASRQQYGVQPSQASRDLPPSSSVNQQQFNQHSHSSSSSARLIHEQRLSTCLNILRHIQRTLRQRHHEAEQQLTRTAGLVSHTTWDLFSQSPQDFMCHEMDMLADPVTTAILSEGGYSPRGRSLRDSEAWMRKLDGLRDLREDEFEAKERVKKIMRQIHCADAVMMEGLKQQAVVLERRAEPVREAQYQAASYPRRDGDETMASSSEQWVDMEGTDALKASKSAASSTFVNWPLPVNEDDVGASGDDGDDDESSSGSPVQGQCNEDCCRHSL